jgi:hypothetical protein
VVGWSRYLGCPSVGVAGLYGVTWSGSAWSRNSAPHFVQNRLAPDRGDPHFVQKLIGFSFPIDYLPRPSGPISGGPEYASLRPSTIGPFFPICRKGCRSFP